MCVQQVSVCVHTPSHTQWLLLRESEPLLLLGVLTTKDNQYNYHSVTILPKDFSPGSFFDLSHQDLVHLFAFHQSSHV